MKEYESTGDELLTKANCLNKAVDSIKEYHEDMEALSSLSQNKPRSSLIATIQRESKQLRQLELENRELKSSLEEHQFALELIMSKYRHHVSQLLRTGEVKQCCHHGSDNSAEIIKRQADKISEMASVMRKAMEIDDLNYCRDKETLARLEAENEGLRAMLKIAQCCSDSDKN